MLQKADAQEVTETRVTGPSVASWLSRAGAFSLDVLLGLAALATIAMVARTAEFGGWLWWVAVATGGAVMMAMAGNRLLLAAVIGWSLGRCLFGIAVTRRDGSRPGPWLLLLRDLAHLLDTASLFIGWLWPLWDPRNRTLADLLLRTEVRPVDRTDYNVRRLVAVAVAAAVLVSAAFTGLSYLMVYRHDRAVEQAREQIQAQGPRIVEEMLSYGAGSMQKDFAQAQTLVTDRYRDQLVDQQRAVQKTGAMTNEYWVVNSAVLSATPDTATMLLAMQGQRQASKQPQRFITATARVSFEKSRQGQWRVAGLTVLTKPVFNANVPAAPGPPQGGGK